MSQGIDYQAEIAKCNRMEDITGLDGLIQKVIKDAVEQVLRKEVNSILQMQKRKEIRYLKMAAALRQSKWPMEILELTYHGHGNPNSSQRL